MFPEDTRFDSSTMALPGIPSYGAAERGLGGHSPTPASAGQDRSARRLLLLAGGAVGAAVLCAAGLAGAGTARVEAMAVWPSGALGQSALVSVLDGMRTGTPQQRTYGYTSVKTPHYDSYLREQADRSKSRSEALKTAFSAPA